MRTNLPVSQKEIDYDENKVFITKTDVNGNITYANDSFVEVSGYSREELIGSPHNMVRHPDMPEWAFKSLWDAVRSGHPWRGLVKNRAKNGDHYWVRATVSPIIDHGRVTGFISMRKKPTPSEIAAAEALYKSGRIPSGKPSLVQRFRNISLQHKLQLLIQPLLLVMLLAGSVSIVRNSHENLQDTAKQRAEAVANEVVDTANMMMVSGQISDVGARQLMVKKLADSGNIVSLRLMRTDQQFGPGLPEEQLSDDVQRNVAASKQSYYALEEHEGKPVFRAVTPYIASHNFHGTDCLTCHKVEEGSVLGVSDVQIDLSPEYDKLNRTILEQVGLQIVFQVVLFFLIKWIIIRFVAKPVGNIREQLNDLINGNMQGQVDISGRDEMGEILCLVQSTKVLLGAVIDQIVSASSHIDGRAKYLSETMEKVADGSQSQADAASTMAAAVEEMTVSIDQISDNAGEVRRISENSASLAGEGGKIVQQVVDGMAKTNQVVMSTAQTIQQLGEQSEHIHSVVKVIKEIADQTNLLALNAAIEAARAGEQGRGFAVVADEVRKLAEKTGGSTQEIADVIEAIRTSTTNAISEMGHAVDMVKEGSALAEKAGASIVEINGGVARALNGVEDISASIKEQSQASREIAVNVEKVAQMSEENSGSVKDVSSTVENLRKLSVALQESVGQFRI